MKYTRREVFHFYKIAPSLSKDAIRFRGSPFSPPRSVTVERRLTERVHPMGYVFDTRDERVQKYMLEMNEHLLSEGWNFRIQNMS